jgi:hypothetical protein
MLCIYVIHKQLQQSVTTEPALNDVTNGNLERTGVLRLERPEFEASKSTKAPRPTRERKMLLEQHFNMRFSWTIPILRVVTWQKFGKWCFMLTKFYSPRKFGVKAGILRRFHCDHFHITAWMQRDPWQDNPATRPHASPPERRRRGWPHGWAVKFTGLNRAINCVKLNGICATFWILFMSEDVYLLGSIRQPSVFGMRFWLRCC